MDTDCVNNAACDIASTSDPTQNICRLMLQVGGTKINALSCVNNRSTLCMSGLCTISGANTLCTNPVKS